LNMAVAKIGNTRIVWKRPSASLAKGPVSCEVMPPGHGFSMEMYVDGEKVSHDIVEANGFGNGEIWTNSLHLDAWKWVQDQQHFCAGDTDGRVTIKMASVPTPCSWMPTMIIELAEDQVEHAPTSLCSLEAHDPEKIAQVDAVPFSKSLFTVDELRAMCDGCQLESSSGAEFAGCNPPAQDAFTGVELCAQQGNPVAMSRCDQFSDPDWKDACLVEVCSYGAYGADETAFFDAGGEPLQTVEDELAGEYGVQYQEKGGLFQFQSFTMVLACDGSVTSLTNPERFTNAHLAFEHVSTKCRESDHSIMWLANSDIGAYACLARAGTSLVGAHYDFNSKRMEGGLALHRLRSYANCDVCSSGCKACSDADTCIVCHTGFSLASGKCAKPELDSRDESVLTDFSPDEHETNATATVTKCPCSTTTTTTAFN